MPSFSTSLALLASLFLSFAALAETSPADYVNPLIDTHKSRWFFFSSACCPFGLVNLSPDTKVGGERFGQRSDGSDGHA